MSETPTRDAKLVQLLNEAYTKEKQLETALQAHVEVTTRDDYAKRAQGSPEGDQVPRNSGIQADQAAGAQPRDGLAPRTRRPQQSRGERFGRGREGESGGPGPIARRTWIGRAGQDAPQRPHRVPGGGARDRDLHGYDSLATVVGDTQTAKLARDILRQEERMQQFLAELLPQLTVDVAHDEIPVSEINGQASHRTAADSKRKSSSSRSKSSSSRSKSSPSRSKAKT